MANEKLDLIDRGALLKKQYNSSPLKALQFVEMVVDVRDIEDAPSVDAVPVVHGKGLYNANEVAEIIAELFGDSCACNFNGIDEWLPFRCELQGCCPNTVGVACWEQYLKHRDTKMNGGNEDG